MKKTLYLSIFFCAIVLTASAQGLEYKGYSGSLFVHSGFIKSDLFEVTNKTDNVTDHQIHNGAFGFGGKIGFRFNRGIRFGAEAYSSRTTYGHYQSTFALNWGGLFVDYIYVDRIVSYFFGATLGGGQAVNTVVAESQSLNYRTTDILRRKYVVGVVTPFCGAEVRVNERIHIALRGDYVLRFTNAYPDWGRGFRIHLGVTHRIDR